MAGKGSRFRSAGISKPKHEIVTCGRPMFEWAMESLKEFFDCPFVFVTQERHNPTEFLEESCDRLGITEYEQVILTKYTDGQASTAVAADEVLDNNDSIVIYNIDTYIEPGHLTMDILSGDGTIPTFRASADRWSFVRTNSGDQVVEVSEKKKISNHATVGFYYFSEWKDFLNAYQNYAGEVKTEYGETYVAPHYNHLINHNKDVLKHDLDPEVIHVLGTPTDLREFDTDFSTTNQ
jgi:dTDP-glucose pyrophosphorylase